MTTLAICAVMRNEGRYVLEWLASHLQQGAQRICVFDNDSEDHTFEVLNRLGGAFPVECFRQETVEGVSSQMAAYRRGVDYLKGQTDFVALIDADEFLHTVDANLPRALSAFPANAGAIAINQRVFGSAGEVEMRADLVTARFTKRAPVRSDENRYFKTICRPEAVGTLDNCHQVGLDAGL